MVMYSPRRSAGFTLIELLIVVVIIGLLASFAVPRFANVKGKAYAAAMRNDLHSLALAQENLYTEQQLYSTSLATLQLGTSKGVTIQIREATSGGWSAVATHTSAPVTCAFYIGAVAPVTPAVNEGAIACRD